MAFVFSKIRLMVSVDFASEQQGTLFRYAFFLTCFLSLCGFVFVVGGLLPEKFAWTASVVIILNGTVTFLSELRARSFVSNLIVFLAIAATTLAVEYVGVTTGFPFGDYAYTNVLLPRVFGVPVAIAFAWYATVMNTRRIAEWIHGNAPSLQIALIAGILTLALDVVLEPMASAIQGYWLWSNGNIPVQNYFSWFALGFFAVLILRTAEPSSLKLKRRSVHNVSLVLYGLQFALFALTDLVHGYAVAAVFGVLFLVVSFVSGHRHLLQFSGERLAEK